MVLINGGFWLVVGFQTKHPFKVGSKVRNEQRTMRKAHNDETRPLM